MWLLEFHSGTLGRCSMASMDPTAIGRMVVMLIFSTVDLILNWVNYLDLRSRSYNYGLVAGPPTESMLMGLFVFNIIGSVFYGMELINCLSMPFNGGKPRLPLEVEQALVLPLESVPLAAINLSVVVCRVRQHTPLQIASCVFTLINVLIRLSYAKVFQQELKYCGEGFRMAVGVIVAVFSIVLVILAGLIWGRVNASFSPLPKPGHRWLQGVSVILLKATYLEHIKTDSYEITSLVRRQGLPLNMPWLLKTLDIKTSEEGVGSYTCLNITQKVKSIPEECAGQKELKFRFRYNHRWRQSQHYPVGLISYNYALINVKDKSCVDANQTLGGDWQVFYFSLYLHARLNWTVGVLATSPWDEPCTVPFPVYDPSIHVCS